MEQAAQDEPSEKKTAKPARRKLPEFNELEERLRFTFGMKAEVTGSLEKGRITLKYSSREELERLYDAMGAQDDA